MDFQLIQHGRSALDFLADLGGSTSGLRPRVIADMQARGISADTLAEDIDARLRQVDDAMSDSQAFVALGQLSEWLSTQHGRVAHAAFDAQRSELLPRIQALQTGSSTLEVIAGEKLPEYFCDVWIHRTTGGWDGHDYQGFIHGELVHREYVAKNYPGDIFAQRREVLGTLPRRDYRRIMEFGTSSGHYTLQLAREFPQASLTGCDLSLRMLEQAQRLGNENQFKWRLLQIAAEATGLPAASFDLVTSYIVLHEIPADVARAQMREAFRLLEPGGDLLFTDVTRYAAMDKLGVFWAEYSAINGGEPWWREAASLDLGAAAQEAGFVDVRSEGLGDKLYPWLLYGRKPQAAGGGAR
jgi:SAM-dependent methyltransferase